MNDDDLTAVRTLVSPRQGGPAPTWADVASRRARPARRSGRVRGVAIPVAVAAAVVAVAAGVAVALRPAHVATPGQAPSTTATLGPVDAATALRALAGVAASTPAVPRAPGQYIYVRSPSRERDTSGRMRPHDHEMWLDPEGMICLKIIADGEDMSVPGPKNDPGAEIAQARHDLRLLGPSLARPTPAWLDALTTDPDQALALFRATAPTGRWSADHGVFDELTNLFWLADPILPSHTRVTLYRAMAGLTGLSAQTVTVQGRDLLAIRRTETLAEFGSTDSDEILFDPRTGRAAGQRTLERIFGTPSPRPADVVGYETLWTWAIVDSVGAR